MVRIAEVGIIVFALGGVILSSQLYNLLYLIHVSSPDLGFHLVTFVGFALAGLGLWLIVQDPKPTQAKST